MSAPDVDTLARDLATAFKKFEQLERTVPELKSKVSTLSTDLTLHKGKTGH